MGNKRFLYVIMLSMLIAGCSVTNKEQGQSQQMISQGQDAAIPNKVGVPNKLDIQVSQEDYSKFPPIEVKRGVALDPEITKELLKKKEELSKPVSGFFKTSLEALKEDGSIRLNFALQNVSGKDQKILYGSKQFDIFVYNEQNEQVYNWSMNKAYTDMGTSRDFKQDEQIAFSQVWNLTDSKGKSVPNGTYRIEVKVLISLASNIGPQMVNPEELKDTALIEITG